jgi:uncharacterized protein YqjF (DUF2071 family)
MKDFKTLHKVNKAFYYTTLLLYLSLYIGMAFQILLGIVQLALGYLLVKNIKKLTKLKRRKIRRYWILVLFAFIFIILNNEFGNDFGNFICLFLIPMLIATYFFFFTANLDSDSFLTAEWTNLVLINYEIDSEILKKYVPNGTELDFWNGKCYISFVGFLFENVRVLGMKIPFHTHFEEVNLRFYVKRFENGVWKRGVVFISEVVPKTAITLVANALYHEHYCTFPMKHLSCELKNSKSFQYQWKVANKWQKIEIETNKKPIDIEPNSEAEFITEHYFGYTKFNEKTTFEYEVRHPRWQQLEVSANHSEIDFEQVYGQEFAFVKDLKPTSVFLAIGSKISVEGKRKL